MILPSKRIKVKGWTLELTDDHDTVISDLNEVNLLDVRSVAVGQWVNVESSEGDAKNTKAYGKELLFQQKNILNVIPSCRQISDNRMANKSKPSYPPC